MSEDEVSDEALMRRYQRGDRSAFGVLVRRHQVAVYGYVLRELGSPPAADELSREVFSSVARAAHRFDPEARVSTRLFSIACQLVQEHRGRASKAARPGIERRPAAAAFPREVPVAGAVAAPPEVDTDVPSPPEARDFPFSGSSRLTARSGAAVKTQMPTHGPPANFAEGLMERERRVQLELPLHQRLGRLVSVLAGYAMRPQLVMGALLLLMLGSSLMLLRARPGPRGTVQVTERGAPETEPVRGPLGPAGTSAESRPAPSAAAPPPEPAADARGRPEGASPERAARQPRAAATEAARGRSSRERQPEAQRRLDGVSRGGRPSAAEAALRAAQARCDATGCGATGCAAAIGGFERVRVRFPGSASAHEATWRAAACLERLGNAAGAREAYAALLGVPSHAARARAALTKLSGRARATESTAPRAFSRP